MSVVKGDEKIPETIGSVDNPIDDLIYSGELKDHLEEELIQEDENLKESLTSQHERIQSRKEIIQHQYNSFKQNTHLSERIATADISRNHIQNYKNDSHTIFSDDPYNPVIFPQRMQTESNPHELMMTSDIPQQTIYSVDIKVRKLRPKLVRLAYLYSPKYAEEVGPKISNKTFLVGADNSLKSVEVTGQELLQPDFTKKAFRKQEKLSLVKVDEHSGISMPQYQKFDSSISEEAKSKIVIEDKPTSRSNKSTQRSYNRTEALKQKIKDRSLGSVDLLDFESRGSSASRSRLPFPHKTIHDSSRDPPARSSLDISGYYANIEIDESTPLRTREKDSSIESQHDTGNAKYYLRQIRNNDTYFPELSYQSAYRPLILTDDDEGGKHNQSYTHQQRAAYHGFGNHQNCPQGLPMHSNAKLVRQSCSRESTYPKDRDINLSHSVDRSHNGEQSKCIELPELAGRNKQGSRKRGTSTNCVYKQKMTSVRHVSRPKKKAEKKHVESNTNQWRHPSPNKNIIRFATAPRQRIQINHEYY